MLRSRPLECMLNVQTSNTWLATFCNVGPISRFQFLKLGNSITFHWNKVSDITVSARSGSAGNLDPLRENRRTNSNFAGYNFEKKNNV